MTEWRTLIVEDDPHIAHVHSEIVGRMNMFSVVGTAETGEEALRLIPRKRPHLLLLDLSLPGMDGLSMLRKLRATHNGSVEVIAVTASRNTEVVRALVHLGVVDYLVKPFSPDRLRQALAFFLKRMSVMTPGELGQEEIDRLCASGRRAGRFLPKGLVPDKLDEVRGFVDSAPAAVCAEDVGAALGMARVTARRYLEYLLATEHVHVESRGDGPGRPRRFYRPAIAPRRRRAV